MDRLLNERWEIVGNFYGTYERTLDAKNRLQVPSKLVKEPFECVYVLKGFEGCLSLYLHDDFERFVANLSALSYNDPKARAYVRLAIGSVMEVALDSHGRLTFPSELLRRHKIGANVIILGVLDHLELWDKTAYEAYLTQNEAAYEQIAAALNEGAGR